MHCTHTYIMYTTFILDAINNFTALILVCYKIHNLWIKIVVSFFFKGHLVFIIEAEASLAHKFSSFND